MNIIKTINASTDIEYLMMLDDQVDASIVNINAELSDEIKAIQEKMHKKPYDVIVKERLEHVSLVKDAVIERLTFLNDKT